MSKSTLPTNPRVTRSYALRARKDEQKEESDLKEEGPTPAKSRQKRPKVAKQSESFESEEPNEIAIALAKMKKYTADNRKINIKDIRDIKKQFKLRCDSTKREADKIERQRTKQTGVTRSGKMRGLVHRPTYVDGKWITKGIDESQEQFDDDEKEYIRKGIENCKEVSDLKYEYIKYLVIDVFLDELKDIKAGKIKSEFHDVYTELNGKSKMDIMSDIRTSLFTNEQRGYIDGLLQGAFDTITKDDNEDIKYLDIGYTEIVMFAEITTRIVKYVHKFKSNEEALDYMISSSREAFGCGDDD